MSENNNTQASTLGSVSQGVAGAVQRGIGQLTGSTKDIQDGTARKLDAEEENERSHASAKLGSVTATAEGGAHVDNKDRQQGSWNQTVGSGKQFVGGLIGNESLRAQGRAQYDEGVRQETSGQASDLAGGYADRIGGAIGGTLNNDKDEQERYKKQHDGGKAAIRSVEKDLQKKADATE
ncbi:uncharacterized protein DFL_009536 [Arthrobotrys flagrans]|uniref:CsbD-like domain-containing protein n=1 Tax=Arthrobotrys flagrans TaxID=97331 RepID=A0A436ZS03_ARTFL|nr:hypothetical protein DFL_009536 [Arthrobotrys flagrans]